MRVEIKRYVDNWQLVKETTLTTIGLDRGKYPESSWKSDMFQCEHSPIRNVVITAKFYDIPSWITVHFTRHKIGIEHFVTTQRTDRTKDEVPRDEKPQGALVNYQFTANAQAIINISRKRLCTGASKETTATWKMFLEALYENEPELYAMCVPECIYRGFCPEMFKCGYSNSKVYAEKLIEYQGGER